MSLKRFVAVSLDVRPKEAAPNLADVSTAKAESRCDGAHGFVRLLNFLGYVFGNLRVSMSRSVGNSPLASGILGVFFVRSFSQVIWVNARRVVA